MISKANLLASASYLRDRYESDVDPLISLMAGK